MPRGDMTGPPGNGPLTGRGMGFCAGTMPAGQQRCFGGRRGCGAFGRQNRRGSGMPGFNQRAFNPGFIQDSPVNARQTLEMQMENLRQAAARIENQLRQMDVDADKETGK